MLLLILCLALGACFPTPVQMVEVTRLGIQTIQVETSVVQTQEVTRMVTRPVVVTATPQPAPGQSPGPMPQIPTAAAPNQATAFYDAAIALAQYYAYYDQGAYTQAYTYLAPSRQNPKTLDEFVQSSELSQIKRTVLVSAQPLHEWQKQQGFRASTDSDTQKRFSIELYMEGANGWAGANPNGTRIYFVTMSWENGGWKLQAINTAP